MAYIYEQRGWPHFEWDDARLSPFLGKTRNLQGRLIGKMSALGFDLKNAAHLETLTLDILKSNEIEGEILDPGQVRSSVARRLGMDILGLVPSGRYLDEAVEMMLDATRNILCPLSDEILFGWHSALFPVGRSGIYKISAGQWRDDSKGPMQVVSGALGNEKIHFQAPAAALIKDEMNCFLEWFNAGQQIDPVLKSGIAHLWFLTLHPFEDGNGRIARALSDRLLAAADGVPQRFYSMSSQIGKERKDYYEILEKTQKGGLDITLWLLWFLDCLANALEASERVLAKVLEKHFFWNMNSAKIQNERQRLMLNKLLDGFEGNLTSAKWAKITKCSPDTALRDIQDLLDKQILCKGEGGGRSSAYLLFK